MEEEKIEKVTKYLCGTCKEELKNVGGGFDAFDFLNPVVQRYCDNKECKMYGIVTVASIIKEIIN
jgi:hypothetical protein